MGFEHLGPLIPLAAIVLGIGGGIIRSILASQERRLDLRLQAQQGQNEDVTRQLAALRTEIASLRDTSTQFDMSIEHSVQRLEEKVARLESKGQAPVIPTPSPEEVQRVGLR